MTYLAQFLISIFGGLFTWLAQYFTRKTAMALTLVATGLAMTTTFYLSIKLLVTGVVGAISNQYLLMGFWALWPDNADVCIAACLSADVGAFVYRYKMKMMQMITASS
ncbi:DUF5455 family protein [Thauera butanivorans]|uniref:DUF5455 family protein n=1 Tax=Thauera butanivorans TaxID=86174 RepID=UPI000837C7BC|nr:DUF5455 family protein [Thauera butanivorans]